MKGRCGMAKKKEISMCILRISRMQSSGVCREVRPFLCLMDNRDQGIDFKLS